MSIMDASSRNVRRAKYTLELTFHVQTCTNTNCRMILCDKFKEAYHHSKHCLLWDDCGTKYCDVVKRMLKHWEECHENSCPLCCWFNKISKVRNAQGIFTKKELNPL